MRKKSQEESKTVLALWDQESSQRIHLYHQPFFKLCSKIEILLLCLFWNLQVMQLGSLGRELCKRFEMGREDTKFALIFMCKILVNVFLLLLA